MRKNIAALACGFLLATSGMALAAPLEVSGTGTIKFQNKTADQTPTEAGTSFTLTLRGEQKIGPTSSLYARLAAQYATNPLLAEEDRLISGSGTKMIASLDQFGIIFKPKNFTVKLGRQEALVGKTALLYSRSETNIGNNAFVDGLSFEGTTGKIQLSGIAAWENNLGLTNNNFYALRAGYNLSKTTNAGATWGQYRIVDGDTSNHWAVDLSTSWGKSSFTGEYAQSSASQDNKAYALTWNYDFNGKTALYLTHFRVESNADMGGQSDFDNNNRGFYYGLTHSFSDRFALEVIYKDQVLLSDDSKNSKLEIWLKHKF
jgi:hypothetical protein